MALGARSGPGPAGWAGGLAPGTLGVPAGGGSGSALGCPILSIICSRSISRSAPRTRTSYLAPRASYPIRSAPPTASPPTPTTSYNFYNLLLPCHDPICCTCTTRTTSHHEPRTMHLPPRTSSCPSPPPATPGTCSFLSEQVVVKTTDLLHLHNPICCTQPGVEPNLYSRQQHSCEHELSARSPALKIFSRARIDRALTDNF